MKKFFTKVYWTQEETQPRWAKWLNELSWVVILVQLLKDED